MNNGKFTKYMYVGLALIPIILLAQSVVPRISPDLDRVGSAAGGGAPTSAEFIVLTLNGTLTGERRLIVGEGLIGTDAGANGDFEIKYDPAQLASLLVSNTFTAGAKQVWQPSATTAGGRIVCAALPSSPATGDLACDSGDSNKLKIYDGTAWVSAGGAGAHNILSATHSDTTVDTPASGDVLYHDGTSWKRLPRGADPQFLMTSGTTVAWNSVTPSRVSGVFVMDEQFTLAACDGATARFVGITTPASGAPTAVCLGSTVLRGAARFADAATNSLQGSMRLPTQWSSSGGFDVVIVFRVNGTGNMRTQLDGVCVATNEGADPAFAITSTFNAAAAGTANNLSIVTQSSITATGCGTGETFYWKLSRLGADANDTLDGLTVDVERVVIRYRRSMT